LNPEWIAPANQQGKATISCEETRLRLDHAELSQLSQGVGPAHDDIGIEAEIAADVEREVT
jgi:hypothetical protein